jgi:hypothetical protein
VVTLALRDQIMAAALKMQEKETMSDLRVAKVSASGKMLMKSMQVIAFVVELKMLNEMTKEVHSVGQWKFGVKGIEHRQFGE